MTLFDGGTFFGREPKYGIGWSDEEILQRAKETGTAMMLATHWEAIYFDMLSGNERMLQIAKKFPEQIAPLAVINPQHYDCTTDYIEKIKADGFAGIACFPYYQGWRPARYAFHKLVHDVAAAGFPLQVAIGSVDELSELVGVIRDVTTPVLVRWVRGGGYIAIADIIAIAKDFSHIFFDVGNLVTLGGVAYLAKTIGADRLYLATNMPLVYEACPQLLLETAKLSESDKDQIGFGILANIFKSFVISSVSEKSGSQQRPDLSTPLRSGRDDNNVVAWKAHLTRPKIDIHWHAEGWDLIEPCTGVEAARDVIKDFNYEALIVSSILALNYDLKQGNANTAMWTEKDPRIHGYIVYDPTRIEESLAELEKYKNHPAFVGVKTIQDYYPLPLSDEKYQPMIQWARDNGWPILCHRNGVSKVAAAFPTVQFVTAHMTRERMPEFVSPPNVIIDISGSYAHRGETDLEAMVAAFGPDRILFAADGPLMTPAWSIGKIIGANLDEAVLEKIYRANARRVFKRLRV